MGCASQDLSFFRFCSIDNMTFVGFLLVNPHYETVGKLFILKKRSEASFFTFTSLL